MSKAVTLVNTPNKTQYFYPADDKREIVQLGQKASTVITEGEALCIEVSGSSPTGYVTAMGTSNANGANFVGIAAEPTVSTDSDYATAGHLRGVWVPKTHLAEAFFKVGAGTFTQADVGRVCLFYTDSLSLNVDGNGLGAVITQYISATKGKCNFSLAPAVTA